jgi:hypothetical protein
LIPTIKEVRGSQVSRKDNQDYFWCPDLPEGTNFASWYGKSNVERLTLSLVQIHGDHLAEILRLPHSLKAFTYHGCILYHPTNQQTPLRAFKRSLDHVAESLQFLDLFWNSSQWYDGDSILSFHNLSSVKFFLVNCSLIYDPDSPTQSTCLAESLPPALEIFYMYGPFPKIWPKKDILECWRAILAGKSSTCLPSLRLVGHWNDLDLLLPLIDLAKSRYIQVTLNIPDLVTMKDTFLSKIK